MIDTCLLIGAGGTGGHLAAPLARLLTYSCEQPPQFAIIDGDSYEDKNVTRQIVGPADIGLNKAVSLTRHLESQGLTAQAYSDYLDKNMLRRLLQQAQQPLIVLAVDNDATRAATLEVMGERLNSNRNFLWISPGNSDGTEDIKGQVQFWGLIDDATFGIDPRLTCENLASPRDTIPRSGGCMEHAPSRPQLIAANSLAATGALLVVQNFLDNKLNNLYSQLGFNGRSFSFAIS